MNFRQGCLADRRGGQEEGEEACVEGGQVAAVHKILESRCSANILSIEISSPPPSVTENSRQWQFFGKAL